MEARLREAEVEAMVIWAAVAAWEEREAATGGATALQEQQLAFERDRVQLHQSLADQGLPVPSADQVAAPKGPLFTSAPTSHKLALKPFAEGENMAQYMIRASKMACTFAQVPGTKSCSRNIPNLQERMPGPFDPAWKWHN